MLQSNRLLTREEAETLELGARIKLEQEVTDAIEQSGEPLSLPDDWCFADYYELSPWRKQLFEFLGPVDGRTVLDLGCGYHPTPVFLALAGAKRVFACDVSSRALSHIGELAGRAGLADRIVPVLCAGERMPLKSESIDLIHGEAVLHHLCLPLAGTEIARVLKPGGRAGFKDPLGHNVLLEFARDYLPYAWKAAMKGTDRPLQFSHIDAFGQHFASCSRHGFGLLSMLAVVLFGRGDSALRRLTHRIDGAVLSTFPSLERYCRFVVTCVEKAHV